MVMVDARQMLLPALEPQARRPLDWPTSRTLMAHMTASRRKECRPLELSGVPVRSGRNGYGRMALSLSLARPPMDALRYAREMRRPNAFEHQSSGRPRPRYPPRGIEYLPQAVVSVQGIFGDHSQARCDERSRLLAHIGKVPFWVSHAPMPQPRGPNVHNTF